MAWIVTDHCHPDRPPAPDTVSKAKARRPPNIPETFPHISAKYGSAMILIWRPIPAHAAYKNKADAETSHLADTSRSSGELHRGTVQLLPNSLLAAGISKWLLN